MPHISVGPLLQARAAAGDALLQNCLAGDGLIPDSIYLEVVSLRLQQQDCAEAGWLLDGFPHTAAQASDTPHFAYSLHYAFEAAVLTAYGHQHLCLLHQVRQPADGGKGKRLGRILLLESFAPVQCKL